MVTPRWLPRRRSGASMARGEQRPTVSETTRPEPERGPKLLLECLDDDADGAEIVAALRERYEITALGSGSRRFEVLIDDAVYPDEAVVRLASVLDEIDPDWVKHIRWPKVQE